MVQYALTLFEGGWVMHVLTTHVNGLIENASGLVYLIWYSIYENNLRVYGLCVCLPVMMSNA